MKNNIIMLLFGMACTVVSNQAAADVVLALNDLGTWDNNTQGVANHISQGNDPSTDNQAIGSPRWSQVSLFQPTATGQLVSGTVRAGFWFLESGGSATVSTARFNLYEYVEGQTAAQDSVGSLLYTKQLSGSNGNWSWDSDIDVDDPFEFQGAMYKSFSLLGHASFNSSVMLHQTRKYYSQWEFFTTPSTNNAPVYGAVVINVDHGGVTHWVETGTGNILSGYDNLNIVNRQDFFVSTVPEPGSAVFFATAVFGMTFHRRNASAGECKKTS